MSITSFNGTLLGFVQQLRVLFQNDTALVSKLNDAYNAIELLSSVKSTERKPVRMFMDSVTPYIKEIQSRDERFFIDNVTNIPFFAELDGITTLWESGRISPANKDAIWQYMSILTMLGIAVTTLPDETMEAVEMIARSIGENGSLESINNLVMNGHGDAGTALPFNPMAMIGMLGGAMHKK